MKKILLLGCLVFLGVTSSAKAELTLREDESMYSIENFKKSLRKNKIIRRNLANFCGISSKNFKEISFREGFNLLSNKVTLNKIKTQCIDKLAEQTPLFFASGCNIMYEEIIYVVHNSSANEDIKKTFHTGAFEIFNHCYSKVNAIAQWTDRYLARMSYTESQYYDLKHWREDHLIDDVRSRLTPDQYLSIIGYYNKILYAYIYKKSQVKRFRLNGMLE